MRASKSLTANGTRSSRAACSTTSNPLDEGLDKLASLAPLLVVDEFASDLIDSAAQDWYEGQHRMLRATGAEPNGPADLDGWRERHPDLHPHDVLLAALRARYDERALEWVPYLWRWLGGPGSERSSKR